VLRGFRRQALHVAKLSLTHPQSGETLRWTASGAADMGELMEALAADVQQADSQSFAAPERLRPSRMNLFQIEHHVVWYSGASAEPAK